MSGVRIGINAHLLSFAAGYRRAGVSQYIEQVARELVPLAAAHDDTLTVFGGPTPPPDGYLPPSVQWIGSRFPTGQAPGRIVWEQGAAPFIAASHRLDVLFCPVNVVPLAARVPCVLTVHDLAFLAFPDAFLARKRRYLTAMTRLSVRKARHVIAVSAHTKADLIRHFGVPDANITVIPNATSNAFRPAHDAATVAQFRQDHDLPGRFVLFVGTQEPRKNLHRLIEAFAHVAAAVPDVHLVVIGAAGWLTSDLAPQVAASPVRERIRFLGYVENRDLPRYYQAAEICCYPSLYEGFGLPPLEAMACGTPVVTSNTSSLPEVVGDAALTVSPTDTTALAAALRNLLNDAPLRARLSAAGIARASHFSWHRTAAATLAVLEAAGSSNK